ncbi:hypothetical protein FJTKL_03553 [Diaporthe vaccinii]|uniref:Uncharacterized protein n=1 Tax=Diaporthe vaccinii TaxID=105482 RepID=A0ABR4DV49_9PEZI
MAPANHRLVHHLPSPDASFSADSVASVTSTAPPSPPRSTSSSCSTTVLPLPTSQTRREPRRRRSRSRSLGTHLPDSVATAFQYLQQADHGRYEGPSWVSFPNASADDLEALEAAAEGIRKYRYDFDPQSEILTLRMPEGQPHSFTKNGIGLSILNHLYRRLDQAIDDDEGYNADALRLIKSKITSNIEAPVKLPTGTKKVPDVAFFHEGYIYPPLVIEIGSSQKSTELPILARDYIGQTEGKIQTVITVHIGYERPLQRSEKRRQQRSLSCAGRVTRSRSRQSQIDETTSRSQSRGRERLDTRPGHREAETSTAGVSLFRLRDQILNNEVFRDDGGEPVEGGLKLNVADFVPRGDDTLRSLSFTVPFKDLYDALKRGEQQQQLEEKTPPPGQTSRKRVHFEFNWEVSQPSESMPSTRELRSSSSKRRRTDSSKDNAAEDHRKVVPVRRGRSQ